MRNQETMKQLNMGVIGKVRLDKRRLANSILVILFPILMIGILGPLEVYASTPTDFRVSMWTVLIAFGQVCIVGGTIGLILLLLLPEKISLFARRILFSFGLVAYVQYIFLNHNLANKDGTTVDWNNRSITTWINFAEWLMLLALIIIITYKLRERWYVISNYVSTCLSLLMLVTIVYLLIITPKGSNSAWRMSAEEQFTLAKDENIIIIILDSYGNKQLEAVREEYPELLDNVKDFTYYTNYDSHYDRTYPCMTAMITNYPYNFDYLNPEEYTTKAWTSKEANDFFDVLHENDWCFNIYAVNDFYPYGNIECAKDKIDNFTYQEGRLRWKRILIRFGRTSIYKFAPYILKPYFEEITYNFKDTNEFEYDFDDCIPHLTRVLSEDGLSINSQTNRRISILHTFGTHSATSIEEMKQCQDFVDLYLEKLKQIGMYDNSTIIITADHGSLGSIAGSDPQPIFFIKKQNEHHEELLFNDAPISELDFQATILELIGAKNNLFGKSIWDWNDTTSRERTYYVREDKNKYNGYTYYLDANELLKCLEGEPTETVEYR